MPGGGLRGVDVALRAAMCFFFVRFREYEHHSHSRSCRNPHLHTLRSICQAFNLLSSAGTEWCNAVENLGGLGFRSPLNKDFRNSLIISTLCLPGTDGNGT